MSNKSEKPYVLRAAEFVYSNIKEIKKVDQKVRVGLRQTKTDPFDWFKDKKVHQIITVKIISTDNKGLTVRPEGCEMDFNIKKSQIAINPADARPSRFTGGERIDCAISELDFNKRKVTLSIKLLEEIEKKITQINHIYIQYEFNKNLKLEKPNSYLKFQVDYLYNEKNCNLK